MEDHKPKKNLVSIEAVPICSLFHCVLERSTKTNHSLLLLQIVAHLDDVVQENPALVSKETISTTLEGRAVVKVTISTDLAANKPIMFYECGIHAREWISPATCLWVMNEVGRLLLSFTRPNRLCHGISSIFFWISNSASSIC